MVASPVPQSGTRVRVEGSLPLQTLLRIPTGDLAALGPLLRLLPRADWATRTAVLSALGRMIRNDETAWRPSFFRHRVARRLRRLGGFGRLAGTGPRGAFISDLIGNYLVDRVWIVRTAAAFAIGECRDVALQNRLLPLLGDPYRAVRMAAAAALAACGATVTAPLATLAGGDPAPERIGDTTSSLEWLGRLSASHAPVLAAWRRKDASLETLGDAAAWAKFLAGEVVPEKTDPREAEIRRYAQEKDIHHNVTKPFNSVDRDQNARLLHAFATVAQNMRVPRSGLVLDLGGGAGWVSDLLTKFGYRPVTIDIAPALLRVGRDRFTRENLPFRPVSGDMTALPITSASVDAVVVIDALHHVPDVPAVFREAFRVLQQGGQFLLAEPGEGHAESEKSRGERLEHGVCEREIHLAEAVRYGREAGFDDVRLVAHYEPILSFSPEDLDRARTEPSERWRVRVGGQAVPFDSFVLQSILSHPVIVCAKGTRPVDSRAPRTLRARMEPTLVRDGARLHGTVAVTNEGDTLWLRGGDEAGKVRLGLQLLSPERRLIHMDFARGVLPRDVAAGERIDVPVDAALPDAAASYVVKLDMVDEHVCWFEDVGSRPIYMAL